MAEAIALASLKEASPKEAEPKAETEVEAEAQEDSDPPANQGQLIADATCVPAALCY